LQQIGELADAARDLAELRVQLLPPFLLEQLRGVELVDGLAQPRSPRGAASKGPAARSRGPLRQSAIDSSRFALDQLLALHALPASLIDRGAALAVRLESSA
jgi:hypothetical protein